MKWLGVLAPFGALAAVSLAGSAARGQEPPLESFGWFADVLGACWVGTFPGGETRHTHCYTSQFDRFIRGTAALAQLENGAFVDRFRGDSVFGWDEETRRIRYFIGGSDGTMAVLEAYYAGTELVFPVNDADEPDRIAYRSVWRQLDEATLEVRREVPDGAGWRTDLTVRYEKRPLE